MKKSLQLTLIISGNKNKKIIFEFDESIIQSWFRLQYLANQ